ncbi:hypothetical protein SSP35_05_00080 [Streptomyces sp. NBRC 110611]|uniref:hypothetical protein n=1 Tax=Streptomyces sp. NBRC 110611 TaxID=1621259 RepID=UPI000855F113|nr:hypothetical protein [Streptomyces sp. NBRC 110611]GAU67441.1 hypothetical protein SSP35_05_00080 [Streptomyces sp. NBRC 110611]
MKSKWIFAAAGAMTATTLLFSAPAASAASKATKISFTTDGTRIRAKLDINSSVAGLGYKSHSVTGYCQGLAGDAWMVKLKDNTTGVSGWSYIGNLSGWNNLPYCG